MATAVPSRFAVLAIDDDDSKFKKNHKPQTTVTQKSKNKNDKVKDQRPVQAQAKKVEKKNSNSKNRKKKKKNCPEDQQWEQWEETDSMFVEAAYQMELFNAMFQSKIDYECEFYDELEHEDSTALKGNNDKNKKKKKAKKATMSLEEFNNMGSVNDSIGRSKLSECGKSGGYKEKESNAKFFERLDKEVKAEIMHNKGKDMLKLRLNAMDDDITAAQLKVEVEKRDGEIVNLREEISLLKQELSQVKEQNKKLCQILSHGEIKDKASILAEVTKLQEIRDELTSEVSSLHVQLEQERSKTRASIVDPTKSSKQTGTEK